MQAATGTSQATRSCATKVGQSVRARVFETDVRSSRIGEKTVLGTDAGSMHIGSWHFFLSFFFLMQSLVAGQKRLETPHLAVRYQAPLESLFLAQ
jgi:hypothetical protein